MKQLLTLLTFGILSSPLLAQDYFPFIKSNISYFEGQNSKVYTLKIKDSSNNQYHFEPNLHINPNFDEGTCEIKTNASWMGRKVIQVSDTSLWFINFEGKPITLYTNSKVGQSWEAYVNGVIPIMFNHLKDSTIKIFGATDSIKIIQTTLPAQSNTTQLVNVWLSKKHGLIKTVNFYTFPKTFQLGMLTYQFPSTLTLISEVNTNLPLQNVTWSDIYNFDVGDEFHYLDYNFIVNYQPELITTDTCRSIYVVYQKQSNNDSLLYKFTRRQYCTFRKNDSLWYRLVTDSVDVIYTKDTMLNKEPSLSQPRYTGNLGMGFYTIALNRNTIEKSTYISSIILGEFDSCGFMAADLYNARQFYYKGVGGPYYEEISNGFPGGSSTAHLLVYYKKLNQTWGNPWPQNLSLNTNTLQHKFGVYPNPTKNILTVNNPTTHGLNFKLLNILGEVVFDTTLNQGENNLNIGSLHAEIYFYHIQHANRVYTGKLVVE